VPQGRMDVRTQRPPPTRHVSEGRNDLTGNAAPSARVTTEVDVSAGQLALAILQRNASTR
jgi:hypothetical protein